MGSALGGVLRFALSSLLAQRLGDRFPVGTLLVNITGSILIGALAGLSAKNNSFQAATGLRQFLMVGVCGGYTTFSAFSLQSMELFRAGEMGPALLYIASSTLLCIGGAAAGYFVAQMALR